MILMYHKVAPESPSMWWVTVDDFYRQMLELSEYEVVSLSDYNPENPNQAVITFDGVYQNVLEHAVPIMEKFAYPFELFVTSDSIGAGNEFDEVEPFARFAPIDELKEMSTRGGILEWHTKSHPKFSKISAKEIEEELKLPEDLQTFTSPHFDYFAYPHGEVSAEAKALVAKKFKGALSCHQGSDSDIYALNRITVTNESNFRKSKISVIIPSYNYGHFLIEAVESVLSQSFPANEILIIDDCSEDDTSQIGEFFAHRFPDLIRFEKNEKNLGIVECFNKAISLTSGDLITILGADNRFRSDYLEKCYVAINQSKDLAVAYTNFALFGERAETYYQNFSEYLKGEIFEGYYHINFPDFDSSQFKKGMKEGENYIHGSSFFKRTAFEDVGGYQNKEGQPEDYNLFKRIIDSGYKATHLPEPLLEYRQHSIEQANSVLILNLQLDFYKSKHRELLNDFKSLSNQISFISIKNEELEISHDKLSAKNEELELAYHEAITQIEKWKNEFEKSQDFAKQLEKDIAILKS